jgi:mono/diheme cytochrome c family protein
MHSIRNFFVRSRRTLQALAIAVCFCSCLATAADEPTRKEKSDVRRIHELIDKGGRLFKSGKYDLSLDAIEDARERLEKLAADADEDLMALLKPEHDRLKLAHSLLTEAGKELRPVNDLPEPVSPADAKLVSFKNEVAPLLVAKCGRCHVLRNRGNFSAASYNALGQSTKISPGMPAQSRMLEIIMDGEMPPGGSLLDSELSTLKSWIAQGAKFDGDDPAQNLVELTGSPVPAPAQPLTAVMPTGKETISFGLHVAPLLVQNCGRCHIDTNNPRGNFNMQTFASFLRGGDGGPPVAPGKSDESLIIQRMTGAAGANVMPPAGKLDDQQIAVVQKWIDEGATFDGGEASLATRTVAARSIANSQSHDQLKADRLILAQNNWKLAMPNIQPDQLSTKNFNLFGTIGADQLKQVGKLAENLVIKIQSTLKFEADENFVKGNVAVFVFERQYDFGEFGLMVEDHALPREVTGIWGYSTTDAYVALRLESNQEPEDIEVQMACQLAALKIATMSADVPRWFADGVGHWVAARLFPRDDAVKTWDDQSIQILSNMQQPDDFLKGRLPEHQSALVAYLFVKQLRSNSARFSKLTKLLREEQSFDDAFSAAYGGSPQSLFDSAASDRRRR